MITKLSLQHFRGLEDVAFDDLGRINLLIDEIENGLYYRGLEDFWSGLITVLVDQNVQLFATTHSRECMEAAFRGNGGLSPKAPLRYLRLDRRVDQPERIVGSCFDEKAMARSIEHGDDKERFAIWTMAAQAKETPRQRLSVKRAIAHLNLDWNHSLFDPLGDVLRSASDFK